MIRHSGLGLTDVSGGRPDLIGDDRPRPGGGTLQRESGASLFILVRIQAGPPRFALTGYAWRSHAGPAGQSVSGVA